MAPASSNENAPSHELPFWSKVRGTWEHLHGSFAERGFSVEWHDFRLDQDLDWSRSFHPGSLEVCLNFSGTADLADRSHTHLLGPNEIAIYTTSRERIKATRKADSPHRFLTVELSAAFLSENVARSQEHLRSSVRQFVAGKQTEAWFEVVPLPAALLANRVQFVQPAIPAAARETWYLGRTLEILAHCLYEEEAGEELFCHRHLRQNRERIERARFLLERDLENPPSLEMLAGELQCSPFYLSRMFAQETGASIPKFLRMKRIEKAAELIRTRQMNVTEAAMAVGYSSLSAFNKAFVEQLGCCPGLYPAVPIRGRRTGRGAASPKP